MKKKRKNKYLTASMERILRWLVKAGPEGELVVEVREAWYGDNRTSIATVYRLLRLCLLRDQSEHAAPCRRYNINEEGRKILEDPDYEPLIAPHLKRSLKNPT